MNGIKWEDGAKHYIGEHNIKPHDHFIDFVYRFMNVTTDLPVVIGKIKAKEIIRHERKMLKLDRNQILIMDALMWHGGKKYYRDCQNHNVYRYSEHYGLLDFNNKGLNKIIIFTNTSKVDSVDADIYLPKYNAESLDYEYIFHTHPVTEKKPGGRVYCGILYEFPSVSDVFHFINHYNTGRTCGSLVVTAEGMYIIKKFADDDKNIKVDDDALYEDMYEASQKAQAMAIEKYGTEFNAHKFYSVIAQNKEYINIINEAINKHEIHIDFYPRVKDKRGRWFINTIYLAVSIIEIK